MQYADIVCIHWYDYEPDRAVFFLSLSGEACNRRSSRDAKPQLFIFHFLIAFAASETDEPRDLYSKKQIVSTCNHSFFFLFSSACATAGRLRFKDNSRASLRLQCKRLLPFVSGPQLSGINQAVLCPFFKNICSGLVNGFQYKVLVTHITDLTFPGVKGSWMFCCIWAHSMECR